MGYLALTSLAILHKTADFSWTDAAHTNFERVKNLIANTPALALFDPTLSAIVTTDASHYGMEQCSLKFMRAPQKKLEHPHHPHSQNANASTLQ